MTKTRTGKDGCQDCVSEGQPHLIWQQFLLRYCSENSDTSPSQGKWEIIIRYQREIISLSMILQTQKEKKNAHKRKEEKGKKLRQNEA